MIVTIIYPKEVAFPFNIPCLSNGDKIKCADMIIKALMGDGFETGMEPLVPLARVRLKEKDKKDLREE